MKHFRRLIFLLSLIFILMAGGVTAMAANNGPCEDEEDSYAFVQFYNSEKADIIYVYSFRTPQEGTATSVKGAVYDKSTNTLTLTNCNMPDYMLSMNMMGDNFKIKLVGTSHIGMLCAWGYGYGGSVEIIGDGKLYVNEKQKMSDGIVLQPEGTKSYFRISGNAEVHVAAGKTNGLLAFADYTAVTDCFVVNGLTGLKKEQASEMRYDEIQAIIVDLENSHDCHVYTKGDNGKKYTVEDYVRTYYNNDGSIKAENVKGYTLYELMLMPGYTDKYYMREVDAADGIFDPEKYGYTDTEENVNGYSYRSTMPAKVYIDQNTGDRCIFMRDAIDDSYKEFENFKYDIKGELGDVTDKYGNVMSYCMVEKSKDNVKFTDVQFYDSDYLLSQGYKISGELEYIKGLYKVYSDAKSAVLTAKTKPECKHAAKVSTVTTKATISKDGVITTTCKSCGKKLSTSKISKASTVRLNVTSCVYNGKVRTPSVIVKDSNGKALVKNKDYKVIYSAGRKNVGKYAVKVTLCGSKYKDSKTIYFTINPKCKHAAKVSTVTTKATISKDGVITTTCKSCGKKLSTSKISKASTVRLNVTSCVYNGKVRTPSVIVKDSNGKALVKNKDYKVIYSAGRKNVGKYAVKVTLCGSKYKDSKTIYFTINPKGTSIAAAASGKGSMTVRWNKQMTQTTGYQLQYCANKNFRGGTKIKTVSKNKTIRASVRKLASGKIYYARVRTYRTVKINGKSVTCYSAWSKVKSVKVK